MVLYGEKLLFRPVKSFLGSKNRDLANKVLLGHYIGTDERNADALVMTEYGVIHGIGVHRRPTDERWQTDMFPALKGFPWALCPETGETLPVALPIAVPDVPVPSVQEPLHRPYKARSLHYARSVGEVWGGSK